jgi:hypothetical protein
MKRKSRNQLHILLPALLFLFQAGCLGTRVEELPFRELPKIAFINNNRLSNACFVQMNYSGHRSWVYVIGYLEEKQEIETVFPIITSLPANQGADSLHGRIPTSLLNACDLNDPFNKTDFFWLTEVLGDSDQETIEVRIAYSEKNRCFYLEYNWAN